MKHIRLSKQKDFATRCVNHAAACILPLGLDADVVAWLCSVMQSSGELRAIEGVTQLERNLKLRRTKLRFPTELEWEKVMLTARLLFRAYEQGVVR